MTTIDQALHVINNLQQTLEQVRRENRYLRTKTESKHSYHVSTSARILRRALDDSIAIMTLRYSGYSIGRGFCYQLGYSERRYFWAMGLLRSARIVSARGSAWLVDDFRTAEDKLRTCHDRIKSQSNALEMVRLYMPRKMQYMYRSITKS